jgi:membrane-associated protease RseP (regulator of RpoE activity)
MLRNYLFIAGSLGIGILIGYLLMPGSGPEQTSVDKGEDLAPPAFSLSPEQAIDAESLAVLQHELQQARQAREQLETRLEVLQIRVEELERAGDTETVITTTTASGNRQAETAPLVRSSVQTLIDAGISEDQAAWIQERLDEIELQKLYLRDRATREGWLEEPRYNKERREYLNAVTELRDEVGDDAYDRLLYTLGRANRVVIQDVLQNSPAAQYGLQGSDQIIEYDGQRIFGSKELSSLVTQGGSGVMTLLRVKREGSIHDIYLPRGPLGIRMSSARVAP